ncbi:MAG: IPT/TIG domain-containing protein, partial [Deltaproteobacteria bacterium]|nr:IPT/TIG domain-containing protein [Deltaproteobacteria bacterium]
MNGLRLSAIVLSCAALACGGDESNPPGAPGGQGGTTTQQEAPVITALDPAIQAGGVPFTMDVTGAAFFADDVVQVDGGSLPTVMIDEVTLQAEVPAQARGVHEVRVLRGDLQSNALELT